MDRIKLVTTEQVIGQTTFIKSRLVSETDGHELTPDETIKAFNDLEAIGLCVMVKLDAPDSYNGERLFPFAKIHNITPDKSAVILHDSDNPDQKLILPTADFFRLYELD